MATTKGPSRMNGNGKAIMTVLVALVGFFGAYYVSTVDSRSEENKTAIATQEQRITRLEKRQDSLRVETVHALDEIAEAVQENTDAQKAIGKNIELLLKSAGVSRNQWHETVPDSADTN